MNTDENKRKVPINTLKALVEKAQANYETLLFIGKHEGKGYHSYSIGRESQPITVGEYASILAEIKKRTAWKGETKHYHEKYGNMEYPESNETLRILYKEQDQQISIMLINLSVQKDFLFRLKSTNTNEIHFCTWKNKSLCGASIKQEDIPNREMVDVQWYLTRKKLKDEVMCPACDERANELMVIEEIVLNK